ncbi:unnamed protein product [Schistocephalus solidus]|uniref:C2H2-type domain-containing protein n=1 Tax=Schistocephalus solidus TaxID=70667 RepID=A0A183TNN4_SCHSO|nr:unnamed protein product [Schistocephalus solidus]
MNITCPTFIITAAVSDYLQPATSNPTTTLSISDEDSVLTCPHCDRTSTSHIGLLSHLQIHRTETGKLVPGAPTNSKDRRLHSPPMSVTTSTTSRTTADAAPPNPSCSYCHRTCTSRIGLVGHL